VDNVDNVEVEPKENISLDTAKVIMNYLSFTSCTVLSRKAVCEQSGTDSELRR